MLLGAARRLHLPGNVPVVKGTTFEGEAFDLESLKGKVVLVDFWATWCPQCLAEMRNIRANYDLYHDEGFEVVAISKDDSTEKLKEFMSFNRLPWITLHDPHEEVHPVARYYGVIALPKMFLVGRDGKVISTNPQGTRLGELLDKEFGEKK
jgi:peroxiredoxin